MEIIYLGHSSFKIKGKTATVITDPYDDKVIGSVFPKSEAEIVTVSHNHDDHNNVTLVSNTKKVVFGPGEYEIAGVSILGYKTYHDDKKGETRGDNTIYIIEIDGVRILHLGDLGHELSDSLISEIGDIDVLMIPVGGGYTIGPDDAVKTVRAVSPKLVIPMHYQVLGMPETISANLLPVDEFVSKMGGTKEISPKLTIKDASLITDQEKLVILEKRQ